jgi:Peptidase family C25
MVDKILITNTSALKTKYGTNGAAALLTAARAYIVADKGKGLSTQLVDISDAAQMKRFKGKPVSSPANERQCKDAVDAIYAAADPDYLVLLDGPDVVPHMTLNNPTHDEDPKVPSDLPYASDAPYTSRDPAKYADVNRVVGRIPGITGANSPDYLIRLLKAASRFKARKRQDYLPYFAISAQVWSKSTRESVGNIFPNDAIVTCPPVTTPGVGKKLLPLSHFINCHGSDTDPNFYGQRGRQYPVAMSSDDVSNNVKPETVVAAECCYGAQLYDPNRTDAKKQPISNAYLDAGAVGFFGSSTVAYGPAEGNSGADLIAQYFLMRVLAGSSIGRACLQARQRFVLSEKMEDPVNLKTLAQFILLGDPSLQPCLIETVPAKAVAGIIDYGAAREIRRAALAASAKAAVESSGFPGKAARPSPKLHSQVHRLARRLGLPVARKNVQSFHIVAGANYRQELKARDIEHKVVMVTHRPRHRAKGAAARMPDIRILVAHAHNNQVTDVVEYARR